MIIYPQPPHPLTLSDGSHIVQPAHRCVTWPCTMQVIWKLSLSTKRDKVHLNLTATQWEGGARWPWSGNCFTLSDKSGYTQNWPEGQHTAPLPFHTFIFTCGPAYLFCSSRTTVAENSFLSSFLRRCVTCSVLSSHHKNPPIKNAVAQQQDEQSSPLV